MTRIAVEIIWNEYFEEKSKIIELGFNSILDVPFDMVSHSTNLKTTRYINWRGGDIYSNVWADVAQMVATFLVICRESISSLANFSLKALHLSIAFSYLGDELTHPFRTPPKWFLGVHERQRQ